MFAIRVFAVCLLKFSLLFSILNTFGDCSPTVCKDIQIKNSSQDMYRQLKNCTRIEGFLQILTIEKESGHQLDAIRFPDLVEITDYLLIYDIENVTSLDWFPNLQYIRGKTLFEGNALIIRHLPSLRHLGFHKLERIMGGVRIEDVDRLCLEQTSDYSGLAEAIKSQSAKAEESKQMLAGLRFYSRNSTQVNLRWNNTSNNTLNTTKKIEYDYITMNLIEFEDLELYYKTVKKYECPAEESPLAPTQHSHEYAICQRGATRVHTHLPFDPNNKMPSWTQHFLFTTVQQIVDANEFISRLNIHVFHSKNDSTNDTTNDNQIGRDKGMKKSFDPKIYQIYNKWRDINQGNETAYAWNGLKPFQHYYMIVEACNRLTDSCKVIGHARNRTLPSENGDEIDDNSVKITTHATSVAISWSEPFRPNGAIISYQIHFHEPRNKTNKKTFCINRSQFLASNLSFVINDLAQSTQYSFRITARSMRGPSNKWTKDFFFVTKEPGHSDKKDPIIYITIGLTVLLVVFVLTATICYIKSPKSHSKCRIGEVDVISENPEYEKFIVDPEWEVKKSDLKLFHILGDGAFGRVYYGELRAGTKTIKCAVKTLNTNHRTPQRDSFLKEANIMKSFVDCHHIVKLIGIVSVENPVFVLMEYMVNGDLKTYLRTNRPDNDENPNPRVPTWQRIFQMAIEISDGMAYLSAHKFVHRDLAARNCMVAEDLTVKIADFGMTRDVYDNDYYRKRDCGLIPVRWMSPEALRDGVFTTYSDIWAYGVVLWEMVTMGAQPYQGYSNESVFQNVIRGVRLTEPDNCPKKLWRIMQFCWRKNPRTRPTFNEITECLLPSANQSFREVCYYLNRKPFSKKEQSLKKLWYSLIPTDRLLNDTKKLDDSDTGQYCQMEPQIQRKVNLTANEYTKQEVEILNTLYDIKPKIIDEINNSLNIIEKQTDPVIDKTIQSRLIEC